MSGGAGGAAHGGGDQPFMLRPFGQEHAAFDVGEVMQQRVLPVQIFSVAAEIEFDIEFRGRIALFRHAEGQEMLERIRPALGHVAVLVQIPGGIEHRHRVHLAGAPPLKKMRQAGGALGPDGRFHGTRR